MLKRTLYTTAAVIALAIGILGLIVPIIPGILFVGLAVVLFANASLPREVAQLAENPPLSVALGELSRPAPH